MCNDFGNRIRYEEYVEEFAHLHIPLRFDPPAPNLEPRDEIWPTDPAPVIARAGDGPVLRSLPWGFAPARAGGRAVINLRAEGRRFTGGRCLVPASHYYEFTGTGSPKTRWRVEAVACAWFAFAGLVGRGSDGPAFALLTVDPGPDVAELHNRQPAILDRAHWAAWLAADDSQVPRLAPAPGGSLRIEQAPRPKAPPVAARR